MPSTLAVSLPLLSASASILGVYFHVFHHWHHWHTFDVNNEALRLTQAVMVGLVDDYANSMPSFTA